MQLIAFSATTTAGVLIGSASSSGGGDNGDSTKEREREQEEEVFYRVMSTAEVEQLGPQGGISILHTENFVTQNYAYVISLAAKQPQNYQHLVVYNMQHGTRNALLAQGAVSNVNAMDFPEVSGLPHISSFPRNEPNIVHVKGEAGGLNFGLRRGTVNLFNSRIISARRYAL